VEGIVPPTTRAKQIRDQGRQLTKESDETRKAAIAAQLAELYRSDSDPLIRLEILRALGGYPSSISAEIVELALQDTDKDLRIVACQLLAQWADNASVTRLARVANSDSSPDVRLAAVRALGRTRNPAAVDALAQALEDRDPAMQYQAMAALRQVSERDFGFDAQRWREYFRRRQDGDYIAAGYPHPMAPWTTHQ